MTPRLTPRLTPRPTARSTATVALALALAGAVAVAFPVPPALAEPEPPSYDRPREPAARQVRSRLVARPAVEWTVTAIGGALWFTTGTLLKPDIAPSECRWCDTNGFDEELRALRWSDRRAADLTSDVISYGVAPASAAGLIVLAAARDGRLSEIAVDLPIVAEALVASGLLGEAFRFSTARERPSVHALPPAEKPNTRDPEENNLSFVSGHVATSFALAFASGTVASIRRRRMAPVVWAAGLGLAAGTSYLRLAADEHYATDVLGGAAIGAAVGLALPLLHRRRGAVEHEGDDEDVIVTAAPAPGGGLLVVRWHR
jgi:membrane-associated phospholipid phosphatase